MRNADSGVLGVLWAEDGLPSRAFPQHARQFPSSTNCSISAFSVLISANPIKLQGEAGGGLWGNSHLVRSVQAPYARQLYQPALTAMPSDAHA